MKHFLSAILWRFCLFGNIALATSLSSNPPINFTAAGLSEDCSIEVIKDIRNIKLIKAWCDEDASSSECCMNYHGFNVTRIIQAHNHVGLEYLRILQRAPLAEIMEPLQKEGIFAEPLSMIVFHRRGWSANRSRTTSESAIAHFVL